MEGTMLYPHVLRLTERNAAPRFGCRDERGRWSWYWRMPAQAGGEPDYRLLEPCSRDTEVEFEDLVGRGFLNTREVRSSRGEKLLLAE